MTAGSPTGSTAGGMVSVLLGCLSLFPLVTATGAVAQTRMNYSDTAETHLSLAWLAVSRHAQLHLIGHSIDYKTDRNRPIIYPIYALRISASTDEAPTDDIRRNAILFECGSHPREWMATESCLTLAQHLVNHAEDDTTEVPELLANVDVWIVALTNSSGRAIDDQRGGDPRFFDTSVSGAGWRGNGDTRGCNYGVNVARNFSAGWTGEVSTDCTDDPDGVNDDPLDVPGKAVNDSPGDFRGFAPFATLEATTLRQFVQNRTISMAVVVHSNATQISNLWRAADAAGTSIADLGKLAWDIRADDSNIELQRSTSLGSGQGQFSAWLASTSDTPGEPDFGTRRAIQTIFVELPFLDANLSSTVAVDAYNLGNYRFSAGDGSNGFHPSNNDPVRAVIRGSFLFMAEELIREARAPGCTTLTGCPAADFGLVGAKIGRSSLSAGAVTTNSAGCMGQQVNGLCTGTIVRARDYVDRGSYYVDYRVQNFSRTTGNDDVMVRLTVDETVAGADGSVTVRSSSSRTFTNLARREARTGRFTLNLATAGADYTITLRVEPAAGSADQFDKNDVKVFKVRAR